MRHTKQTAKERQLELIPRREEVSQAATITAPAMTLREWEALPPSVRYFIHWEDARRPKSYEMPSQMANLTRGKVSKS